jgi:hypothetical protein
MVHRIISQETFKCSGHVWPSTEQPVFRYSNFRLIKTDTSLHWASTLFLQLLQALCCENCSISKSPQIIYSNLGKSLKIMSKEKSQSCISKWQLAISTYVLLWNWLHEMVLQFATISSSTHTSYTSMHDVLGWPVHKPSALKSCHLWTLHHCLTCYTLQQAIATHLYQSPVYLNGENKVCPQEPNHTTYSRTRLRSLSRDQRIRDSLSRKTY